MLKNVKHLFIFFKKKLEEDKKNYVRTSRSRDLERILIKVMILEETKMPLMNVRKNKK